MDRKNLSSIEVKDETKGEVRAVFATLNVKDKDNDVTVPGAFSNGAQCVISAYDHKSWEGALPVGKGTIREVGDQAVCDMQFFMDTTHGRDTFNTVKSLGELGEWSYGYDVKDSEPGTHEGKSVRVLKKMHVFEVSPVLRGAGEGTRTVSSKANRPGSEPDGSYPIMTSKDVSDAIDDFNRSGGSLADRAHIIARAEAIGATDKLPDDWQPKGKSLNEEISHATAVVRNAVESAERVVALRAEKGKSLSQVNRQSLAELDESLTRLKSLITEENDLKSADEELRKIWLRSIAANLESE